MRNGVSEKNTPGRCDVAGLSLAGLKEKEIPARAYLIMNKTTTQEKQRAGRKEPQSEAKVPTVDREGVRLLAIELGASAAARKLGLSPNTVRSWAKRYNWNLPARAGRPAIVPATDLQRPGDLLLQEHKTLEETTRTALMQTVAKAAKLAAGRPAFDVNTTGQLRDLALTMAKLCGWDGSAQPSVTYYGDDNRTVVVCDEKRRAELVAQRERLLASESGRMIEIQARKSDE
jgi:putative ATPase subunit gpP of terminase